jgi:hypothetical protein
MKDLTRRTAIAASAIALAGAGSAAAKGEGEENVEIVWSVRSPRRRTEINVRWNVDGRRLEYSALRHARRRSRSVIDWSRLSVVMRGPGSLRSAREDIGTFLQNSIL